MKQEKMKETHQQIREIESDEQLGKTNTIRISTIPHVYTSKYTL